MLGDDVRAITDQCGRSTFHHVDGRRTAGADTAARTHASGHGIDLTIRTGDHQHVARMDLTLVPTAQFRIGIAANLVVGHRQSGTCRAAAAYRTGQRIDPALVMSANRNVTGAY